VSHSTRKSNDDAPAAEFLLATTGGQAGGRPNYKAAVQRLAFFSQAMAARLDRAPLTGTGCWAQEPFEKETRHFDPSYGCCLSWWRLQSGCPLSQVDRSVRVSRAGSYYRALWPRLEQWRNWAERHGYKAMGRIRTVLGGGVPAKRVCSAMTHFLLFDIVPPRARQAHRHSQQPERRNT